MSDTEGTHMGEDKFFSLPLVHSENLLKIKNVKGMKCLISNKTIFSKMNLESRTHSASHNSPCTILVSRVNPTNKNFPTRNPERGKNRFLKNLPIIIIIIALG